MSRPAFIAVTFVVLISYAGYASAGWPECKTYVKPKSGITEFRCFGVDGLKNLTQAPKRVNSITIHSSTIITVPTNAFSGFRDTLKYLDLHSDLIQIIDTGAFSGLTKLRNLTLWGNRLARVEAAWFKDLNQLRLLDLSFNWISVIEDRVFENIPNLVNLYIDYNQIQTMNENVFTYMGNLKRARIGKNPWHWWDRARVTRQLANQHVDYSSEWDNYDWINHIVWTCMEKHKATENDDSVLDCASEYLLYEHSKIFTAVDHKATLNCGTQARALYICSLLPSPGQNTTDGVVPRKVAVRKILQGFYGTFKSMRNPDLTIAYPPSYPL